MEKIIRAQYKKALSMDDLRSASNGRLQVFTYEDLYNIKHIDELFYPYNACIILYQSTPNFGHWVTLIRRKNNTTDSLEHFDPYGVKIDDELNGPNRMKFPKLLSRLILKSGIKTIISNVGRFQSQKALVNTCGRWALIRALLKNKSLEEFTNLFHNQKLEPDFYVTALTMFI